MTLTISENNSRWSIVSHLRFPSASSFPLLSVSFPLLSPCFLRPFPLPSPCFPLPFSFLFPFSFPFSFLLFSLPFPCFILPSFSFSSHFISSPPYFYPSKKRMSRWRASRNRHFDEARKQDPENDETTGAKKVETSRLVERDVSTFLARVLLQFFQSSSCLKRETSGAKTVETSRLTRRDVSTFLARVLSFEYSSCLKQETSRAQKAETPRLAKRNASTFSRPRAVAVLRCSPRAQCEDPETQNHDHLALGNLASRAIGPSIGRNAEKNRGRTEAKKMRGHQDAEVSPDAKPEERKMRWNEDKT